eukprot:Clim_evm101s152 gene=Clim_evmTU101s152
MGAEDLGKNLQKSSESGDMNGGAAAVTGAIRSLTRASAPFPGFLRGALCMAPMVRCSNLSHRVLALKNGADYVYTEEIIDHRLVHAERKVNTGPTKTVDFIQAGGRILLRIDPEVETGKVILQLGTANGPRALKAAKLCEKDVCAVDVNMGCPKGYSVSGGMGAALLGQQENAVEIVRTLADGLSIPVTAKIRLLPTVEETRDFVARLYHAGASAVAIHGRFVHERPRQAAHPDLIVPIAEALKDLGCTVLCNGNGPSITNRSTAVAFQEECGAEGVLIARAAQWDPSVFRADGKTVNDVTLAQEYLKLAVMYDEELDNVKYSVLQILRKRLTEPVYAEHIQEGRDVLEMAKALDIYQEIKPDFDAWEAHRDSIRKASLAKLDAAKDGSPEAKRRRQDSAQMVIEMDPAYEPRRFRDKRVSGHRSGHLSPKHIVYEWYKKQQKEAHIKAQQSKANPVQWDQNKMKEPVYTIEESPDRMFRSSIKIDDTVYKCTTWQKSKKFSDQAAAFVVMLYHNIGVA